MAKGYSYSPNCKYIGKGTDWVEWDQTFYPIQTCSHNEKMYKGFGYCIYTNKGTYLCKNFKEDK